MTTGLSDDLDDASALFGRAALPVSFAAARRGEPLVYVSPSFERLTGYRAADCLGENCRFLQGPSTDPSAVARVREGIDAGVFRLTSLANYRADGTEFANGLLVGPLRDADDRTLALIGLQWDVGETLARRRARLREPHWEAYGPSVRLDHFERLVHLTIDASRELDGDGGPMAFVERLVALAHPHQYPPHDRLPNWTRIGSLLPFLVQPFGHGLLDELHVEDDTGIVAVDVAYALSLGVHTLARAAWGRTCAGDAAAAGGVELEARCRLVGAGASSTLELEWRASRLRVVGSESETVRARAGLDVAAALLTTLGGELEFELDRDRLHASLRLPNRPCDVLDRG